MHKLQATSDKQQKSYKRGFTLIELLVVITIIGILAAIGIVSYSSSRASARDAKRISDIGRIQTSVEQYFNSYNGYPGVTAPDGSILLPGGPNSTSYYAMGDKNGGLGCYLIGGGSTPCATPTNFLTAMPQDPNVSNLYDTSTGYLYTFHNPDQAASAQYVLRALLETNASILKNSDEIDGRPWGYTDCADDISPTQHGYCVGNYTP